jgi:hypothetical protein
MRILKAMQDSHGTFDAAGRLDVDQEERLVALVREAHASSPVLASMLW